MQQLRNTTVSKASAEECAAEILDAVPEVMRFIRTQMRWYRGSDLSVPQFRTLVFLSRHAGASLSALAEHLGLSLPATSRLVEGLVRKSLAVRRVPRGNRRVVALSISARGARTVLAARQATEKRLRDAVAPLPSGDCAMIRCALRTLREEFARGAERTSS